MTINILALQKENGQRFVFTYDDESVPKLLETLVDYSVNNEIDFSVEDAVQLAMRVRSPSEISFWPLPANRDAIVRDGE